MPNTLFVMVKEPRPGRVKTRLGRDIGYIEAAWWYRHQVQALLQKIDDPRWQTVLAVAPDHEGMISRVWPSDAWRVAQGAGDLGQRMGRLLRTAPKGKVCIIGSDIPGVQRHHINEAFESLGRQDAVFGPSNDGGYWLVGLKRTRAVALNPFKNIRWSTEHALSDTKAALNRLSIGEIERLDDIDTVEDLRNFP